MNKNTTIKTGFTILDNSIEDLIQKRKKWENGTLAASNQELYTLLAGCLDLFLKIKNTHTLSQGLNLMLKIKGITYNSSTSLELKIIRLVFETEDNAQNFKNRLFGYARVIRVGADAKQTGATLPQFIIDNHGVEEIRRGSKDGASPAQKQKQHVDTARSQLALPNQQELVSKFKLHDQLQPKDGEQYSLALVRKNPDGTGSIIYGTNNVSVVSSVLALAGKDIQAGVVKAAEIQAAQRAEQQKQANIAALVDELDSSLGQTQPSATVQPGISAAYQPVPA